MEIMRYKVAEANRTRKLRQLSRVSSPEDLRGEISAMRLLAQESLEQGNVGLSNLLLTGVGKLARDQIALKRLNQEFLDRDEVRRLGERLCTIVLSAIKGRFPGWEKTVDDVVAELKVAVEPCEESNEQ